MAYDAAAGERTEGKGLDPAVLVILALLAWWLLAPAAPSPAEKEAALPAPSPALALPHKVTKRDRDLMIRTVIGEAMFEPRLGQIAVAQVIRTRWQRNPYGWKTISQVVTANGVTPKGKRVWQFEPWMNRTRELMGIGIGSRAYRETGAIVDQVLAGKSKDPTNGAFYFLNEATVRKRTGGSLPAWAQKEGVTIGRHTFYRR